MRSIRTIITTMLATGLATLGYARTPARVAAPTFSALSFAVGSIPQQQDDQKPKDKPDSKTQDTGKQQEKPAPDAGKPAPKQPAARRPQAQENKDQTRQNNTAKQATSHASSGRRVSDADLKAHFGQEHKFSARQVITTTTIVPNQTRFVYTGYTFVFADAWPAGWAFDDDCYIVFIDGGYYLLDVAHPGVQIALTIVG
jgi:hypothetical protein